MITKKLQGLIYGLSSEEYHSQPGTWSSSQLKKINEDEELFHRLYIDKSEEKEHIPAFDIGTYFHTGVLEPHKIKTECAVFRGVRRGAVWEKFQVDNKGRAIITENEQTTAEGLIKAVKNSPVAMGRIKRGKPEVSAFVDIIVSRGNIFSSCGTKILGDMGWKNVNGTKVDKKDQMTISLKVRADLLHEEFILDLKSTTGNAKDKRQMKRKVSDFDYDLSAALYLDLFTLATGREIREFIWTFASKDKFNCRSYMASAANIQIGRAKWKKAVIKLSDCILNNWVFEDYMDILDPEFHQNEWIRKNGEDLL